MDRPDAAAGRRLRHVLASTRPAGGAPGRQRLCVVTGANKGIGYAIAKQLGATAGVHCIATARSAQRGGQAVAALIADGVPADSIEFRQLDLDRSAPSGGSLALSHVGALLCG